MLNGQGEQILEINHTTQYFMVSFYILKIHLTFSNRHMQMYEPHILNGRLGDESTLDVQNIIIIAKLNTLYWNHYLLGEIC